MSKHVLIVTTSADQLENGHATGLWLEEFAAPYLQFEKQGYKVTVASIEGGDVPIDANSFRGRIAARGVGYATSIERYSPT